MGGAMSLALRVSMASLRERQTAARLFPCSGNSVTVDALYPRRASCKRSAPTRRQDSWHTRSSSQKQCTSTARKHDVPDDDGGSSSSLMASLPNHRSHQRLFMCLHTPMAKNA